MGNYLTTQPLTPDRTTNLKPEREREHTVGKETNRETIHQWIVENTTPTDKELEMFFPYNVRRFMKETPTFPNSLRPTNYQVSLDIWLHSYTDHQRFLFCGFSVTQSLLAMLSARSSSGVPVALFPNRSSDHPRRERFCALTGIGSHEFNTAWIAEILPGKLYIGPSPFQTVEHGVEALSKQAIDFVKQSLLSFRVTDRICLVDPAAECKEEEEKGKEGAQITTHYIPVCDSYFANVQEKQSIILQCAERIHELFLSSPETVVYLHCARGFYRCAVVLYAYLLVFEDMGLQDVKKLMSEKRPTHSLGDMETWIPTLDRTVPFFPASCYFIYNTDEEWAPRSVNSAYHSVAIQPWTWIQWMEHILPLLPSVDGDPEMSDGAIVLGTHSYDTMVAIMMRLHKENVQSITPHLLATYWDQYTALIWEAKMPWEVDVRFRPLISIPVTRTAGDQRFLPFFEAFSSLWERIMTDPQWFSTTIGL